MRLLLGTVLLALAATVAAVPTTLTGSAAAAAGPASVTLEGRGYGHGKGLSQHGAQGRATAGESYRAILGFYYPGTRRGEAGGALRVLVTADSSSDVLVRHASGLTVRSVRTGRTWKLARRGAERWRITAAPGNRNSRLWVRTDKWRVVRDIAGQAEFRRTGNAPIRLYTPAGAESYRGRLRSAVPSSGRGRDTVNVVRLEDYLQGVVPREMPALWHRHAVRAQAVAARTYAVHERTTTNRGHFDVWDTTQSQVYGGVGAEHPAATAAIRATAGEIRTHGGRAAFTQFSASNGGWTVAGSVPYQVAEQDPYDRLTWETEVSARAIERAWPAIGDLTRLRVLERDGRGAYGGRVVRIRIEGADGRTTVSGETFRSVLGLRSTLFTVA